MHSMSQFSSATDCLLYDFLALGSSASTLAVSEKFFAYNDSLTILVLLDSRCVHFIAFEITGLRADSVSALAKSTSASS